MAAGVVKSKLKTGPEYSRFVIAQGAGPRDKHLSSVMLQILPGRTANLDVLDRRFLDVYMD